MAFTFVDLFAGIGGFHAAMTALGGNCVYASEIDPLAAKVYEANWGLKPAGDITLDASDTTMLVPDHDVLLAGFPCQPFSKSGKQRGMEEARGTLFWNIAKILEVRRPKLVILENVRNIAGPRHRHEWEVIIATLRSLGYSVSQDPLVMSPHLVPATHGGRPQVRERVFIVGTLIPAGHADADHDPELPDLAGLKRGWNPQDWNLLTDLPLENLSEATTDTALSDKEKRWISAWDDFVRRLRSQSIHIPSFPIWVDSWGGATSDGLAESTPDWKKNFIRKNTEFFEGNKTVLNSWLHDWGHLSDFPRTRRKFEWQAQDAPDLWSTVMHFRPSGIRAKKATYVPALVAITQTSIIGPLRRRLTVRECARLQGFPDWFDFGKQSISSSYKQLGNAVNVGVVYGIVKALVTRDARLLLDDLALTELILEAPPKPRVPNHNVEEASMKKDGPRKRSKAA
jgi:DNA (cytosine-5)-methyltransferase 1